MDFWRGRYSFGKLAGLVDILEKRSDSYLTWARQRDVDVYRAASRSGPATSRQHRPQSFEMSEQAQIQAAQFQLLQQLIKVTARDKKYKPKAWPMPETAAEIVKREDADQGYENLMSEIRFLPREEFEAHIAEHKASQTVVRKQAD